ncbi:MULTISPECIES: family 16 glycoside hydrolase [Roseicella]|uniref:DUF1080 domain-containing protein n=2 Tax=Roseicella TaxID=2730923 RepID=A0A9X1L9X4_9PROT|nr:MULTISPECIES: family 16 glycoside hydrolase [Roseicella]MCB4824199.1 DUF1080 domain-containing protein [Roseicella aerolata]RAI56074.1 hypothetical protein DOO78_22805 [Roseicella frigidaeris]
MPQQLPLLVPNPSIPQDFQQTAFAHDLVGRYVCSTWDEAVTGNGGAPFDAVVVGAGMFGGYCADKLYRFGDEGNLRILVLDAGALLVTTHLQNLPKIGLNAPGARVVRTNAEDPGTQNVVWGFPWHSDRAFPGLAYCVGGRSVFWGGWAPRLVADDLKRWPDEVRKHLLDDAAENYVFVEQEIGVAEPTDYLETDFSKVVRAAFAAAIPGLKLALEDNTPLAIQGQAPDGALFSFDKYSSANLLIDALRDDVARRWTLNDNSRRRIMLVPRTQVTGLQTDGTGRVRRIEVRENGVQRFLRAGQELVEDPVVVLAAGTIETTRLALASFPADGMGANLMAHLRSNTVVRVRRSALGLPPKPAELETAAFLLRGSVKVGGEPRQFHIQVTCAPSEGTDAEGNLFTAIPDLDHLQDLKASQNPNWVVVILRGIGEMEGDRTIAPPDGPKDLARSWMNLAKDADQRDQFGMPRAWVNLVDTPGDRQVWQAMDKAAADTARALAKNKPEDLQWFYDGGWKSGDEPPPDGKVRDNIGSTHHEAGTLWMGPPGAGLTDADGRFHHVGNAYVAGPALFPTVGSANPSLTALALARKTARAAAKALLPKPDASFKPLAAGGSLVGWLMAGSGGFRVLPGGVLEGFGGIGLLWYTREQFGDFLLRLEWRAGKKEDNSGVFIRFPPLNSSDAGVDWRRAVNRGYEIQIDDTGFNPDTGQQGDAKHRTGAVYSFAPSSALASKAPGDWNAYEIEARGDKINVTLNGTKVVTDFIVDDVRPRRGHIGLQNHGAGSTVQFRNLQVRSL